MGLENTTIYRAEVLSRFNGHTLTAIGKITLYVRTPPVLLKQTFMIITDLSLYNRILGWRWLVRTGMVTFIEYQKIWFRILREKVRDQVRLGHIPAMHCTSSDRVKEEVLHPSWSYWGTKGWPNYQIAITADKLRWWHPRRCISRRGMLPTTSILQLQQEDENLVVLT